MKNNVRVESDTNLVLNALVEIRTEDEEGNDRWHDIRHAVRSISWTPTVGDVSQVTLDLICAEVKIEGLLSNETREAFASALRLWGWTCEPPEEPEE